MALRSPREWFTNFLSLAGFGQGEFFSGNNPALASVRFGPDRRLENRCRALAAPAVRRFRPLMTPRARRALFTVVLFFAVCALVGSLLQRRVGAQSATDESQLRDSLKSFTDVYALVEKNYAEPINGDKADTAIYDGAIPGHAAGSRPALQFLRSQGLCPPARRSARPLLRRGHGDPAAGTTRSS